VNRTYTLDACALLDSVIVTSDHHEFDIVEQNEAISFQWIR